MAMVLRNQIEPRELVLNILVDSTHKLERSNMNPNGLFDHAPEVLLGTDHMHTGIEPIFPII